MRRQESGLKYDPCSVVFDVTVPGIATDVLAGGVAVIVYLTFPTSSKRLPT